MDVMGACGDAVGCPRGGDCEAALLNNTYFFHLALENSVCEDYVTEKYLAR